MKIIIKKLSDLNGKEHGTMVTAMLTSIPTEKEKADYESQIYNYIHSDIYPNTPFVAYRDYEPDGASITALINVNEITHVNAEI